MTPERLAEIKARSGVWTPFEANIGFSGLAEEEARELIDAVELGMVDLNARLSATVHALGGTVEGNPTGQHNYLQRIRELRAIELQLCEVRRLLALWATEDISSESLATELSRAFAEKR